jgi:proteasome lid subunit RPN8/RPN11
MSYHQQPRSIVRGGGTCRVVDAPAMTRSEPEAGTWELPELRSSRSPIEVTISRSVRETMLDDAFWLTRSDGLEAGGFLFGPATYTWHKEVRITHATPTANAVRSAGNLKLDVNEWLQAERSFERAGRDDRLLGIWHTHPQTSARNGAPSEPDLRAFLGARDWNEEQGRSNAFSVGLIFSASEYLGDSWGRPGVHCYVTRREGYCRNPVCEPAEVRWR